MNENCNMDEPHMFMLFACFSTNLKFLTAPYVAKHTNMHVYRGVFAQGRVNLTEESPETTGTIGSSLRRTWMQFAYWIRCFSKVRVSSRKIDKHTFKVSYDFRQAATWDFQRSFHLTSFENLSNTKFLLLCGISIVM